MIVLHTCRVPAGVLDPDLIVDGTVDHEADLLVERTTKLGCGCLRYRSTRCDGTPIEWLTDTCGFHAQQASS